MLEIKIPVNTSNKTERKLEIPEWKTTVNE
jgi:hypothetical protein